MAQKHAVWANLRIELLCFLGFFIHTFEVWGVNAGFYPAVADFFPASREIATLFSALFYIFLGVLVQRKPALFKPRFILGACLVLVFFGSVISQLALQAQSAPEMLVSMIIRLGADGLVVVLINAALCALGSPKRVVIIALASTCLSSLLISMLPPLGGMEGIAITFGCVALAALVLFMPAKGNLDLVSQGEPPAVLSLSNPSAFLSWRSGLFVCIFIFSLVFGVALTTPFASIPFVPQALVLVVSIVAAVWFCLSQQDRREDSMFAAAAIMIVAGLAFMPLSGLVYQSIAEGAFLAGLGVFDALIWLVVYAVCVRSFYATLPALCTLWATRTFGVLFGAMIGHAASNALVFDGAGTALFSALILVAFFSCLWIGFRRFSFREALSQLTEMPAGAPVVLRSDEQAAGIEATCARLASLYGLTAREAEIFLLLAKGRNGRYIQERFTISRNTAKTHIRNIYAKLDVHSHQELIDYVEKETNPS